MKLASVLILSAAIAAGATGYGRAAERFGPIINPGTPDAAVIVDGRPVQIDYLHCVPALRAGTIGVVYWEDGSVTC